MHVIVKLLNFSKAAEWWIELFEMVSTSQHHSGPERPVPLPILPSRLVGEKRTHINCLYTQFHSGAGVVFRTNFDGAISNEKEEPNAIFKRVWRREEHKKCWTTINYTIFVCFVLLIFFWQFFLTFLSEEEKEREKKKCEHDMIYELFKKNFIQIIVKTLDTKKSLLFFFAFFFYYFILPKSRSSLSLVPHLRHVCSSCVR